MGSSSQAQPRRAPPGPEEVHAPRGLPPRPPRSTCPRDVFGVEAVVCRYGCGVGKCLFVGRRCGVAQVDLECRRRSDKIYGLLRERRRGCAWLKSMCGQTVSHLSRPSGAGCTPQDEQRFFTDAYCDTPDRGGRSRQAWVWAGEEPLIRPNQKKNRTRPVHGVRPSRPGGPDGCTAGKPVDMQTSRTPSDQEERVGRRPNGRREEDELWRDKRSASGSRPMTTR